ncbi:MAG: D-alanyl-D-alanine carboxypeptidase [Oscillospiraceae bacterium]|jgi:D-alanyl-D-alanine carboxypeptidase (penicillin-binding protein 5/6)|nr:D-alanyl-D-alanine carboxypeptidase [Oscillospiraceae bacterium]
MQGVKKAVIFLTIVLALALNIEYIAIFPASAFDPGIETIYSESVIMVHLDTDITVFSKNEFERRFPASTTKIMTALVVLENVENLNDFVTVTDNMNFGFLSNYNFTDAQVADIVVGQTNLTYNDLLHALMIYSACDAANILAYSVGGTIANFVVMMNQKAAELGCINTNFANPHGLHQNDNYSCAWDMFLISRYVHDKYPRFMDIANLTSYRMPANGRHPEGVVLPNTNRLIRREFEGQYYEFARGIKTGSFDRYLDTDTGEYHPGHFSLVSLAQQGNNTYMLVTLGAPFHDLENPGVRGFYAYDDHLALYRWAFSSLEYKMVMSANDIIAQIEVENGTESRVQLRPATDFSYMLPAGLDHTAIHRERTLFHQVIDASEGPILRGEVLGYVEMMLAGKVLAKIDLLAFNEVQPSFESRILGNVTGIFSEWWFQTGIALVAAMTIFVVILRLINGQRAKLRRNRGQPVNRGQNRRNTRK